MVDENSLCGCATIKSLTMLLSNTSTQMESSDRKLLLTTGVELRRGGVETLLSCF